MKKQILTLFLSALLPLGVYAADQSNADFPVGLWHTAHYKILDDKDTVSKKPVKLDVCLKKDGTWQTLGSADGMRGRWSRESNDVHLTGNGSQFAGTGDITLVIPYQKMTGNWQSWSIKDDKTAHLSYLSEWKLAKANTCTP